MNRKGNTVFGDQREPQMSQREIKRNYQKLIHDVETKEYYKIDLSNRVNCYTCASCGHITKTKDIHPGVTPMFFECEKCCGSSSSSFYKDIIPERLPTIEWYRPNIDEIMKYRKDFGILDHVFQGGLLHRKIK